MTLDFKTQLLKNTKHAIIKRDNSWLLLPNKADLMSDKDILNLSSLKIKEIKLNEKLIFNKKISQVTSEVLGLGWSYDHSTNGIWSDGEKASIVLDLITSNLQQGKEIMSNRELLWVKVRKFMFRMRFLKS